MDAGKIIRPLQAKLDKVKADGLDVMLCSTEIIENVITLLKVQEAKNVIDEKRKTLIDDSYDEAVYCEDTFYHCPSCNRILSRTHMNKDIHFCSSCGQAVKWND